MLASRNRFHGHGSLRYVHKNATAVRSSWLVLKVVPNTRRKHSRVAVIVSKKTHKSAVGRNRIRRRIYEMIRHELESIPGTYDIAVLVVSAEVRTADTVELYRSLRELLVKSGVYSSPQKSGILSK